MVNQGWYLISYKFQEKILENTCFFFFLLLVTGELSVIILVWGKLSAIILSLLPYSASECRWSLHLLIFYIKVMPLQFVFCCYPGKTVTQFSFPLQASCASYICFFWWILIFPSGVWHVGCASHFMGCQTFSFSSCCRCCQNTKLVRKEEKLFSAAFLPNTFF